MTVERFLNHLYYSYAGLNRTLFNDAPYERNGVAQDSFAGLIFTATLGRYTIATLYFLIICPMHLAGLQFSDKTGLIVAAIVSFPILSLVNSTFIGPVYNSYFKEFSEDKNYNSSKWNWLAFLLWFLSYCIFFLLLYISNK